MHAPTLAAAMVGDAGTGKSNLRTQFTEEVFEENSLATVGVDFSARTLRHHGTQVRVQVWDSAGEQHLRTMDQLHYYRSVHGVLVVFDLARASSLENGIGRAIPTLTLRHLAATLAATLAAWLN